MSNKAEEPFTGGPPHSPRKWRVGCVSVLVAIPILIVVALVIGYFALQRGIHPRWVEHYSVIGDQVHVVDDSGSVVSDALVMRVAAISEPSGGWGVGETQAPKAGDQPWRELEYGGQWNVTSTLTDAGGNANVPHFDAQCKGENTGMGSISDHGYFLIVVYKRGYETASMVGDIDTPLESTVKLHAVNLADPNTRSYQIIRHFVLPRDLDNANRTDRPEYFNCLLPDGRTLLQFAEPETVELRRQSKNPDEQRKLDRFRGTIASGHPGEDDERF